MDRGCDTMGYLFSLALCDSSRRGRGHLGWEGDRDWLDIRTISSGFWSNDCL